MWVVVPAHDEAARLADTLGALAAQRDRAFTLLVVDNASADGTGAIAREFAAGAPFPVEVIEEPEKGVGSAVDTGFRHAIDRGATMLARTDADCLPRPDWTRAARAALTDSPGLVCGRITARRDEHGPLGRAGFGVLVRLAALFGRLRPEHARRKGYKAPYRMHAGNN
ncbi:glycosyltransferase family A protein, partial [Streptomyces sp. NPDC059233]